VLSESRKTQAFFKLNCVNIKICGLICRGDPAWPPENHKIQLTVLEKWIHSHKVKLKIANKNPSRLLKSLFG